MGFLKKSMFLFSRLAEKYAPSATPLEGLMKEKKTSYGILKEYFKILLMMGGGAAVGSFLAVATLLSLLLLIPFLLFQVFFFPIAAPITVFVLIGIVGIFYAE